MKKSVFRVQCLAVAVALLGGCAGRVKVLDPNTASVRVLKATPFTPLCDGYFVPDATMLRIENGLSERDVWTNGINR